MEWISVKDKLPEPNIKVLGLYSGGCRGPELLTLEWHPQRGWYNDVIEPRCHLWITYWSEMPTTPEVWFS
jgi:hypothetical protein